MITKALETVLKSRSAAVSSPTSRSRHRTFGTLESLPCAAAGLRHSRAPVSDRLLAITNQTRLAALAFVLGITAVAAPISAPAAAVTNDALVLWYDKPAARWEEALPIGNGRLGAMIFGGVSQERLQLNEGTLWAGGPYNPVNPQAKAALPEVRKLVFDGKFREASKLTNEKLLATPRNQMPYQTVGDLQLSFPDGSIEHYRRDLNLDMATATVSYTRDGVRYSREVFANAADNVIVVRLAADKPGSISFAARMKTPMLGTTVSAEDGDTLVMRGKGTDSSGVTSAIRFEARVKVIAK
jgi:alpha-L-fucosidase 2